MRGLDGGRVIIPGAGVGPEGGEGDEAEQPRVCDGHRRGPSGSGGRGKT